MKLFGKELAGDPKIAAIFLIAFAALVLFTYNCEGDEAEKPKIENHEKVS